MVKIINRRSGSIMLVADDRVNEYLAAGHKLAVNCEKTIAEPVKAEPKVIAEPVPEPVLEPVVAEKPKAVKKTVKKATKKK